MALATSPSSSTACSTPRWDGWGPPAPPPAPACMLACPRLTPAGCEASQPARFKPKRTGALAPPLRLAPAGVEWGGGQCRICRVRCWLRCLVSWACKAETSRHLCASLHSCPSLSASWWVQPGNRCRTRPLQHQLPCPSPLPPAGWATRAATLPGCTSVRFSVRHVLAQMAASGHCSAHPVRRQLLHICALLRCPAWCSAESEKQGSRYWRYSINELGICDISAGECGGGGGGPAVAAAARRRPVGPPTSRLRGLYGTRSGPAALLPHLLTPALVTWAHPLQPSPTFTTPRWRSWRALRGGTPQPHPRTPSKRCRSCAAPPPTLYLMRYAGWTCAVEETLRRAAVVARSARRSSTSRARRGRARPLRVWQPRRRRGRRRLLALLHQRAAVWRGMHMAATETRKSGSASSSCTGGSGGAGGAALYSRRLSWRRRLWAAGRPPCGAASLRWTRCSTTAARQATWQCPSILAT